MPWMLLLHISALLGWCGSLLYLPALLSSSMTQMNQMDNNRYKTIPRTVFTLILTPAALVAIVSGTLIFLQTNILALWLLVKLTLVSGLVVCHVLLGLLIIRKDRVSEKKMRWACFGLSTVSILLMIPIVWLVLAKPF